MRRPNRFTYERVIQQKFLGQWEDFGSYTVNATNGFTDPVEQERFKNDLLKCKADFMPQCRFIFRKENNIAYDEWKHRQEMDEIGRLAQHG